MPISVKYDVPIEVTKEQYEHIVPRFRNIIVHRKDKGKYYIKLWYMQYKGLLEKVLEETKN